MGTETRHYYKCLRGVADLPDDRLTIMDEKERIWDCIEVSKDEALPPELISELNIESSMPVRGCIIGCDDLDDLKTKLSDVVD